MVYSSLKFINMKRTLLFIWNIFIIIFVSFNAKAESPNNWDYPVKPGTSTWFELSSHDEMIKACQIPEEILKSTPTKELIELCLNYPLLGDIFAYNKIQEGVSRVSEQFNGLNELINRDDCVNFLFDKMKNQNMLKSGVLNTIEIGKEISKQMVVESLLSKVIISANIEKSVKHNISILAVNKLIYKRNNLDIYGINSLKTLVILLGRSLEKINNNIAIPSFNQFIVDENLMNSNIIEELLKQYIVTFKNL